MKQTFKEAFNSPSFLNVVVHSLDWKTIQGQRLGQSVSGHQYVNQLAVPMYTFIESIHSVIPATSVIIWSAGNPIDQHSKQIPIVTRFYI